MATILIVWLEHGKGSLTGGGLNKVLAKDVRSASKLAILYLYTCEVMPIYKLFNLDLRASQQDGLTAFTNKFVEELRTAALDLPRIPADVQLWRRVCSAELHEWNSGGARARTRSAGGTGVARGVGARVPLL